MDEWCLGRAARHEVAGSEPHCDLRQMCLTAAYWTINLLFIFLYAFMPTYLYIAL
jgi:hypothetical protein